MCNSALGMGNFKIPPGALHASRDRGYWEKWNGRINDTVSGWCAGLSSDQEWYQISLDTEHYITAVANQGTPMGFVYEFTMAFSRGLAWFDYMENGTIKVQNNLPYITGCVMNQILRSNWLPERARWSHLARSGLPAELPQEKCSLKPDYFEVFVCTFH